MYLGWNGKPVNSPTWSPALDLLTLHLLLISCWWLTRSYTQQWLPSKSLKISLELNPLASWPPRYSLALSLCLWLPESTIKAKNSYGRIFHDFLPISVCQLYVPHTKTPAHLRNFLPESFRVPCIHRIFSPEQISQLLTLQSLYEYLSPPPQVEPSSSLSISSIFLQLEVFTIGDVCKIIQGKKQIEKGILSKIIASKNLYCETKDLVGGF